MTPNRYQHLPDGKTILFIAGGGRERATLIDTADLPKVLAFPGRWYAQRRRWTYYAAATACFCEKRITVRLHRYLMDPPEDMEVDHVDHDGLNNTRNNLRIVEPDVNKQNCREWGEGGDIGPRWYEEGYVTDPFEALGGMPF